MDLFDFNVHIHICFVSCVCVCVCVLNRFKSTVFVSFSPSIFKIRFLFVLLDLFFLFCIIKKSVFFTLIFFNFFLNGFNVFSLFLL